MAEKRYYAHKHLLKENEVHDKRCHRFMSLDETVEHLNNEYWKYKQLFSELKEDRDYIHSLLDGEFEKRIKLEKENEYLKKKNNNLINMIARVQYRADLIKEENEQLKQDLGEYCDFSLHDVLDKKNKKIERLQSTLAYRSNQLALMEQLINDLGHEEMNRQMEEILND